MRRNYQTREQLRLAMTPERRALARPVTLQQDRAERELGAPAASWPRGPVCRLGLLLTSAATSSGSWKKPARAFRLVHAPQAEGERRGAHADLVLPAEVERLREGAFEDAE